ncbi:hypothetical protein PAHAL_4G108300 [Panicum hallii]|jgi:hypothetical protein|uniref:Uncharacterized protein n=1 Tax=Panicum hallii TaxID=206008 RepID=A0A2S3HIS6_9POAL|nr:hypothetical protein PAHAL_4G108300 [Panicum hallii]
MVRLAAICWAIWKSRNSVCFQKKVIRFPTEIICLACTFLLYWTELQKIGDKMALEAGTEALKAVALHFHPRERRAGDVGSLLLQ